MFMLDGWCSAKAKMCPNKEARLTLVLTGRVAHGVAITNGHTDNRALEIVWRNVCQSLSRRHHTQGS